MDAADLVQHTAAPPGSSLYYSMLDLSRGQRESFSALFALRDEALNIIRDVSEPQVRAVKTRWWQDELQRVNHGNGQHPITQVLGRWQAQFEFDIPALTQLFEAVQRYDHDAGLHYEQDLVSWCEAITGTVVQIVATLLGNNDPRLSQYGRQLGTAFQLSLHVSEMAADLQRQVLFIPQQEMQQLGVEPHALFAHRHNDEIGRLMALQTHRAMDYHSQALAALAPEHRYAQRMGVILHNLDAALLDEIKKEHYRVTQQQIALTPIRKLWISWRTRRREHRREKQRLKSTINNE